VPPSTADLLDPNEVRQLLQIATDLARSTGAYLLAGQYEPRTNVESKSTATDLVSEMDRNAEVMITEGILAARPHDGLIGEEGADRVGSTGISWAIDPLDGTVNYLYGWPLWAVSIGATDEHGTVAGAVAIPAIGELYTAGRGMGAFCNGKQLTVSAANKLEMSLVGTGFAYKEETRAQQAETVRNLLPRIRDLRRGGAAAVDLCFVAAGRLEGYYEHGTHIWDRAAGVLCVTEAGGVVSNANGADHGDDMCLATVPAIHAELAALIR
jgi:myo-inositol-1(or 4)-monophosphatase